MRAPEVYWRWFRWQVRKDGWEPTDTGWVLTIAIIWLVSWIAYPIREGQTQSKLTEFLTLRTSEMGDTLAGVFSALAFVWIIVTVFMQSRELREQRKEFREQRKATQDMAKAMAAQVKLSEEEKSNRSEEQAKLMLDQHLLWVSNQILTEENWGSRWSHWGGYEKFPSGHKTQVFNYSFYEIGDQTVDEIIRNGGHNAAQFQAIIAEWIDEGIEIEHDAISFPYRRIAMRIQKVFELQDRLSPDQRERILNMDLTLFDDLLFALLEMDIWKK